jgi:hypothetical protein
MSHPPPELRTSLLYSRLSDHPDLAQCVIQLRDVVEVIAGKIAQQIPEYTDHSISHLDSLWTIVDKVLTQPEIAALSVGEAFILGCAFYVHDLGMAVGATPAGATSLKQGASFQANAARLRPLCSTPEEATIVALRIAARQEHAARAYSLSTELVPGLGRYLIEDSTLRHQWAAYIGKVGASHHWSMAEVDREFGTGPHPDAIGGSIDLAYVACVLRIADYAHINMARSSILERMLRPTLPQESTLHWLAQENITGPIREGAQLVYGSSKPIKDVDAWWTFFELASGLDAEITSVREYLGSRAASRDRFTLEGVRAAKNPQVFASRVATDGFEPLDIRFHPDSLERLIEILGGSTLYGGDRFAPIRELLQNARDAVSLLKSEAEAEGVSLEPPRIVVELNHSESEGHELVVTDNGVGMTERVMANYLLGIAADYWHSADFYAEHPRSGATAFQPVGRFGIGFLSVFMLGDKVLVRSQSRRGQNLLLQLRGLGRRGALMKGSTRLVSGTAVSIHLKRGVAEDFAELNKIVLARAPMLNIPIEVIENGAHSTISPGWWHLLPQNEFLEFLQRQPRTATTPARHHAGPAPRRIHGDGPFDHDWRMSPLSLDPVTHWSGKQPELLDDEARILAVPGSGGVLLCCKGFAVRTVYMPGIIGMVNINNLTLDASRSNALDWDAVGQRERWLSALEPHITQSLDSLATEGDIPARFGFLVRVGSEYGSRFLAKTTLPWVTVKGPLGDALQISITDLQQRLLETDELLLTYGASPWQAGTVAHGRHPKAGRTTLVIPVSSVGQPDPGSYEDLDEMIWGPFPEHFKGSRYSSHEISEAVLLCAILDVIAKTWGLKVENLYATNCARKKSILSAHLQRNLE